MTAKTDLSKYNNHGYRSGNFLVRLAWYFSNILFFKSRFLPISFVKVILLRLFGAKIGKGVLIKPSVNIKYPWKLKVGNNVWMGEDVWIDNLELVDISDNVCISQGAMLLCGNHDFNSSTFDLIVKPIVLEDGVWIGAKSIVTPGVIAGTHAVRSAGSMASKNLEAYSVYQGNPAVRIKNRIVSS